MTLLVTKHNQKLDWEAGYLEVERLNALPEGTEGKPDYDGYVYELNWEQIDEVRDYWQGPHSPLRKVIDLGGYDLICHTQVSTQDPDATDEELSLDSALNALEFYGIMKVIGFINPLEYRRLGQTFPNTDDSSSS